MTLNLSNVQLELFFGATDLFAMAGALSSNYVADVLGRRLTFWVIRSDIYYCYDHPECILYSYATLLMIGRAMVGSWCGIWTTSH
jgi:MFS-type transporter involved in bile tolerance (Atg22 family)